MIEWGIRQQSGCPNAQREGRGDSIVKRYERLNSLLETLAEKGNIDVDDLADQLQVSAATIRRDLDHLGKQQLLTRTRGGAVANAVSYDLPLRYKTARFASEKQRIAQAASTLVRRGMVIGMNGGTTISEVARTLATRPELSSEHGEPSFTLVTNALNIANELIVRPHVKMVLTGGVARPQSYEMIGPLAHRILADLSLDIAFLGVDGIDETGATAHHEGEANINALIVSRAAKVVVVADSSKLGHRAFARICELDSVDTLVTDVQAEDADLVPFTEAGIEVVRA
jgi:DeoR family transcriptional regulator, aga operon transcriptional repressor